MNDNIAAASRIIWLVRHGNREDFVDPHWADTAERPEDPGLSIDGVAQAQLLAERLREEPVDAIFSSPFLRAVQTAHYTCQTRRLPLHIEHGLGEHLNAHWFRQAPEWLPPEELKKTFSQVDEAYRSRIRPRYPESSWDALERVGRTVRLLLRECRGNLLIVGHAVTVSGAAGALLRRPPSVECPLGGLVKLVETKCVWGIAEIWPGEDES